MIKLSFGYANSDLMHPYEGFHRDYQVGDKLYGLRRSGKRPTRCEVTGELADQDVKLFENLYYKTLRQLLHPCDRTITLSQQIADKLDTPAVFTYKYEKKQPKP